METNNRTQRHGSFLKWIVTAIVVVLVIWSLKWIWPGHRYEHGWDHHRGLHPWTELSQGEMNERMEHGAEWAFKKLDTTDEQEEVIMAELKSLTPNILKLQGEKLELENKFRAALEQETVDREALNELKQEVKDVTNRSLDRGMESFITIWETLTKEQREALLERWRDK